MRRGVLTLGLIGAGALVVLGMTRPPKRPAGRLVRGECADVFAAPVCVWARVSGTRVLAFGATVPYRTITAAPAEGKMIWPPPVAATIPLPDAVRRATGFDNFQMSWEHHGHPPGPYFTPHFDFHFYTLPVDRVRAIDCSDPTKPARLPSGYALPDVTVPGLGELKGLCVPTMGMHGAPAAELARTTPFEQTILVGYYGGAPIFLEPMVSRTLLLARKSFTGTVPAVEAASARFPATFRAEYNPKAEAYDLVFTMADER